MTNHQIGIKIYTVRKGVELYRRMLWIMDTVREEKEITNVRLQELAGTDISNIMKVLEECGKVKSELRKEEYITRERWGYHGPLDEEGFEITDIPDTITIVYHEKPYVIKNPEKDPNQREYGEYKERVQVKRKYWCWVG